MVLEECTQPEKGCVFESEEGVFKRCVHSPCRFNTKKFGVHERILDNFKKNKEWNDAYYYFKNLLPFFNIKCDLDLLMEVKRENPDYRAKDLPPGCRLFVDLDKLKKILGNINIFEESLSLELEKEMGTYGKTHYKDLKVEFRKLLDACLIRLQHLSMDIDNKRYEQELGQEKLLQLYGTAFEASKKGLNVTHNVGNVIEKGFEDAGNKALPELMRPIRENNLRRVEEAKVEMERRKRAKNKKSEEGV